MKYAFNTWAYSSFAAWLPAYTLDEAIRRLASIGYDGVEIGCAAPHAWPAYLSPERRRELGKLLDFSRLEVVSLLATPGGGPSFNPASPYAEERDATVKYYQEVTDLASDLGARKSSILLGGKFSARLAKRHGRAAGIAWIALPRTPLQRILRSSSNQPPPRLT